MSHERQDDVFGGVQVSADGREGIAMLPSEDAGFGIESGFHILDIICLTEKGLPFGQWGTLYQP